MSHEMLNQVADLGMAKVGGPLESAAGAIGRRSIGSQVASGTGAALALGGAAGAGAVAASPELQEKIRQQGEAAAAGGRYGLDVAREHGAAGWNTLRGGLVDATQSMPVAKTAAVMSPSKAGGSVPNIGGPASPMPAGATPPQPALGAAPAAPRPVPVAAKGSAVPGGTPMDFTPKGPGQTGGAKLASYLPSSERALEMESLRTGRPVAELVGRR